MAPVVHGLEAQYYNQIEFSFLDIDDPATNPFKQEFGFTYQPMFVLLDADGATVKTWYGSVTTSEFEEFFALVQ